MSKENKGMFNNNTYDLMEQLTVESKSLWRIKNNYKNDANASDCGECRKFWEDLEKDKEAHIRRLNELIKAHT